MSRIAPRGEHIASDAARFAFVGSQKSGGASRFLKRLFDISISGGLLIALSPVLAATALAVFATLGRPLMFKQKRCGKGQQDFIVGKFRTMSDARDAQGMLLPDEQRQTEVTGFLRRIRVDELPQLFAVLRGDMSFVGPRPLPIDTIAEFGAAGELRCSIAPGMTGWAQVNGNTLLTSEQKMALDIYYIDHRSLWMDVRIVLLTLRTIIVGETLDTGNIEIAHAHFKRRLPRALLPVAESK